MELKLNNKRTILVGLAFMLIMLFWTVYDTVIAKMLVDNFGLNQTWSGAVMALDNVLALFMLPFFGRISDKTHSKMGRRKPYVLIGTIIASVLIVGVSFFDLYQQFAVNNAGITAITPKIVGDVVIGFEYMSPTSLTPIFNETKSILATIRAREIFQAVTMAQPMLLVGFMAVLFLVLTAMGIFRSPAVSIMSDVTVKPLRSKANAIINLMGTLGGGISYVFMIFLAKENSPIHTKYGYVANMLLLSVLMVVFLAIFMSTVKENEWSKEMLDLTKQYNLDSLHIDDEGNDISDAGFKSMPPEVRRSFLLVLAAVALWFIGYNAATTKFSVYATNHLNIESFSLPPLIATASAALFFIPIGILSTKVGRRRMIMAGIILLTISFTVAIFVTEHTNILMFIVMALVGVAWAAINVNSYPMVVEMSRFGNIGVYTGYYYTASMSAMIITPILSGFLMDITQYYPVLFIYSAIFTGLSIIPMYFVKHGEPVSMK